MKSVLILASVQDLLIAFQGTTEVYALVNLDSLVIHMVLHALQVSFCVYLRIVQYQKTSKSKFCKNTFLRHY